MLERLQKYMAGSGVASRRKSEEIIAEGRVKVNETVITELGYKIDTVKDKVYVDGRLINTEERKIYIALNKPVKYISTVSDERGRKTILDLVKVEERVFPIGRLDYDTSGLILLTNDGEVYNNVIHPRREIDKVYIADVEGIPSAQEIKRFCEGIDIGGYITSNAKFTILKRTNKTCTAEIIIHEGKNRQIRKMCEAINHPVIFLRRISVGNIKLEELQLGTWRHLTDEEVSYLKSL